ncbi:MAG: hypothetical protein ACT4OZ_03420 [Gemmatimonadota bacterium]
MKLRVFLTAWILVSLHWATDFAREHYLVLSIAEQGSFDLSEYLGLHEDIFRNPPHATPGVHHGGNPGISMLAAVPYALARPLSDAVVRATARPTDAVDTTTATYRDTRRARVEFYTKVRERGLDVKFGLVALLTLVLCMAPLTALSVVAMYNILRHLRLGERLSIGLSLLFLAGTPTLFRSGFLNQNMAIAAVSIMAFWLLWRSAARQELQSRDTVVAGLLAGFGFASDYSGAVGLAVLGLYAVSLGLDDGRKWPSAIRRGLLFTAGALPMIGLLWFYQWQSFGNPVLPPQNWMPNQNQYVTSGYQGVGGPSFEIARLLLFEPRYGLFMTAPLTLLALASPWFAIRNRGPVPRRELLFCIGFSFAYLLFFSTVRYVHLQWNTGFRYLMPAIPFLFIAALPAFLALPRLVAAAFALAGLTVGLSLAMVRSQAGVFDNVLRVVAEGPQLPWLTTLSKMSQQYMPWLEGRPSSFAAFLVATLLIWAVWRLPHPWRPWNQRADQAGWR